MNMASWFENGRSALFEALSHACDQIDRDLAVDFQRQSVVQEGETDERSDVNLALIDELREENERLRNELAASREASKQSLRVVPAVTVENTPGSVAATAEPTDTTQRQPRNWKAEYIKVGARFNALSDNFRLAKLALERRRDERDTWMKRAKFLESRILATEQYHGIEILDDPPHPQPTAPRLSARSSSAKTLNTSSQAGTESDAPDHGDHNMLDAPAYETLGTPNVDLPRHGSGEKVNEMVIVKPEASSDEPIVVSERAVRKRKRSDAGDDTLPRKIKDEPEDDPILAAAVFRSESDIQESLDLGDVTNHMVTPRKPKSVSEASVDPSHASMLAAATPITGLPQLASASRTIRANHSHSALTPMNVNRRLVQTAGPKAKAQTVRNKLHRGIASLVEDGSVRQQRDGSGALSKSRTRLSALLDNTATDFESPLRSKVAPKHRLPPHNDLLIPHRRELPFEKSVQRTKSTSMEELQFSQRGANALFSPQHVSEAATPTFRNAAALLRNKPVSELRPNDFKINPRVNEGHDYAFSEVVRGRGERACLPGCTDMHCCGKEFRALAASQRPKSPLTAAQRQDEQALLEQFLGDHCYRLAGMTKEERYDVWLQAKTQELANKYGKHRHRFSRKPSPPGFWQADFPSTQELEAERAEAAKREKATVQERHREAMKVGGRWMFRDE